MVNHTQLSGFLAHGANLGGRLESMPEHVLAVAERAAAFAAVFGAAEQARATGLLHDLGKYAERFRRRVTDQSGTRAGNHAIAGAVLALGCYKRLGWMPAAAILGHHGGLERLEADWQAWAKELARRLQANPDAVTEPDLALLKRRFDADGLALPPVPTGLVPDGLGCDDLLDARMLFSALVDADFVETEAHFAGDREQPRRYRPEGPPLEPQRALAAVEAHVWSLQGGSADPEIAAVRATLREACDAAADQPPGLFTLAAPTGSGKTLAMLTFALRHAIRHGLRRIVLVLPFLNILDQTARLYRGIFSAAHGFPEGYVLEDHSLADRPPAQDARGDDSESESQRLRRLLAENWDAPIVLTTSVRCLEGLMSSRPSDCRKLHRLARSILLFDEVQTLPRELAVATLATLSRLSGRFGATVLFATATQPAFEHLDGHVRQFSASGWRPRSVLEAGRQERLFAAAAKRTQVRWEHDDPLPLEALAGRLAEEPSEQWLCIVNLKRHAQRLARLLVERGVEGVAHLSTSMCPLHRQHVLARVERRLQDGAPVRLVSTQCVEAGVDVDFPVVYRALAPLEAIAQAAGRCNRHGTRPQPGRVHVITVRGDDRRQYPPGYDVAAKVTETFVTKALGEGVSAGAILHDPGHTSCYFRDLYVLTALGAESDRDERALHEAIRAADFRQVAELYRLIRSDTINVLVPYGAETFAHLSEQILDDGPRPPGLLRSWIAAARPLTVTPYRPREDSPLWPHLREVHFARRPQPGDPPNWYIALPGLGYDDLLGLEVEKRDDWQII